MALVEKQPVGHESAPWRVTMSVPGGALRSVADSLGARWGPTLLPLPGIRLQHLHPVCAAVDQMRRPLRL